MGKQIESSRLFLKVDGGSIVEKKSDYTANLTESVELKKKARVDVSIADSTTVVEAMAAVLAAAKAAEGI